MATIGAIVAKAAELKSAADALAEMISQRSSFVAQRDEIAARISTQQAQVQALRAELVTLVNEA